MRTLWIKYYSTLVNFAIITKDIFWPVLTIKSTSTQHLQVWYRSSGESATSESFVLKSALLRQGANWDTYIRC